MSLQSIPVVPFTTGLESNKDPFLFENDGFPSITDGYLYQGRIYERKGNKYLGRIEQSYLNFAAQALGNTAGGAAIEFIGNIYTILGIPAVGIQLSERSVTFTIAAPVGPLTYIDQGDGNLDAGGGFTGTINYFTGDFLLNHPANGASAVTVTFANFFGRPVMGLRLKEETIFNVESLIAFDTVKANIWNSGARRFIDISHQPPLVGAAILEWTSTDTDFFWTCNFFRDDNRNKLFWATNNVQYSVAGAILRDGIQVYNGLGWVAQIPQLNSVGANRYLNGCLILIPYKNRMVALNTLESSAISGVVATRYSNRARWSWGRKPYVSNFGGGDVGAITGWNDDVPGRGGWVDAPTAEAIVSCQFFKDTLIVFFERSTWALVYIGNPALPFVWQQINSNLGCESTFSTVDFDRGVFAVGDKAIITSDSVNVQRIDEKIPQLVYDIHNGSDGVKRVHGIRDYYYQFVYWTLPLIPKQEFAQTNVYPNAMLVYNYLEGSYSIFRDSYTCLGRYQSVDDVTWANSIVSWQSNDNSWIDGRDQADFPEIVGGNQVGFVSILNKQDNNEQTLYIQTTIANPGITQAVNCLVSAPLHNLIENDYVIITEVRGMTEINGQIGKVKTPLTAGTFTLDIDTTGYTPYLYGGKVTRVNTINVFTKKFNPFFLNGIKARLNYADFYVSETTKGEFNVDIFTDDNDSIPMQSRTVSTQNDYGPTVKMGKMWQRVYFEMLGQFFQLKISLTDTQIRSTTIRNSKVIIHALNLYVQTGGRMI